MKRERVKLLSIPVMLFLVGAGVEISAQSGKDDAAVTIRQVEKQVVLYTIYRGDYAAIGPSIGKLYAMAGQKGIIPRGNATCAYLNNPKLVSKEHWLTEIRIPVAKDALKHAGTLGALTDVKELKAMETAVIIKPEGMADADPLYDKLAQWVHENGYMAVEGPMETYLTNAMGGNYAQMKAEIALPVEKVEKKSK